MDFLGIRLPQLALLVAVGIAPALLEAGTFTMPTGARSWIELQSSHCSGGVSDCMGGENAVSGSFGGDFHSFSATASTGPDSLKGIVTGTGAFGTLLQIAKMDTFVLASDTLSTGTSVNIVAQLLVEGTLEIPGGNFAAAGVTGLIGTWNPNPAATESQRVLFAGGTGANRSISGVTGQTLVVSEMATYALTATIGTPFDLGFKLTLNQRGSNGAVATADFSHTATISFSLPENVTISSQDGFGEAPEPATALLSLSCLATLAAIGRRSTRG